MLKTLLTTLLKILVLYCELGSTYDWWAGSLPNQLPMWEVHDMSVATYILLLLACPDSDHKDYRHFSDT